MCQHYKWCCTACEYLNIRSFRCLQGQRLNRACTSTFEPSDMPPNVRPQLCDGCGTPTCTTPHHSGVHCRAVLQPAVEHMERTIKIESGTLPESGLEVTQSSRTRSTQVTGTGPQHPPSGKRPIPFQPSAPKSAILPSSTTSTPRSCPNLESSFRKDPTAQLRDNAAILLRYRRERADALGVVTAEAADKQSSDCLGLRCTAGIDHAVVKTAWERLRSDLLCM